jgi:GNAT superfamily N-acetyltransferase
MTSMNHISIEPMTVSDIESCRDLVERVFRKNVAPLYSDQGVREFMKYCNVQEMATRMELGALTLTAGSAGRIVGLAQIVERSHIALFFVETELHRKGIGRKLFETALTMIRERSPDLEMLTVNSSPNSIVVYERLGFRPTGEETTTNGIRYLPMAYDLSS